MSGCSRKRKADCKASPSCYWVKGKGCLRKTYQTPRWDDLLSRKYSLDIDKIPVIKKEGQHLASKLNDLAIEWLEKKYSSKFRDICVCHTGQNLEDRMLWTKQFSKSGEFELYVPQIMKNKIQNCLDNSSNVIIISYSLMSEKNDRSHRNIIIINKFLRTIELYDPNGGIFHEKKYKNQDIPFLKKFFKSFPELSRYRIVKYDEIWKRGFQYYETKATSLINEKGKCMFWSIFLAELRIKYFMINPDELFDKLLSQIENGEKPEFFSKFIKDYMMYIHKKTEPEHSPHIYSILSVSGKDAYEHEKKYHPGYVPVWERRDDYNRLTDISMTYLQEKYKNVCVAFIPTDGKISDKLMAWIDLRPQDNMNVPENKELLEMTNNKGFGLYVCPLIRQKLLKCLENEENQIIIVPISIIVWNKKKMHMGGHKVNLIINRYLKTTELYDPNGGKSHTKMYGDFDIPPIQKFIRSIPKIRDYTFYAYKDINPEGSFQSLDTLFKKQNELKTERAKCSFWNNFIADVRCKYYYIKPDVLIPSIIEQVKEEARPAIFNKMIKDYITYMEKKL